MAHYSEIYDQVFFWWYIPSFLIQLYRLFYHIWTLYIKYCAAVKLVVCYFHRFVVSIVYVCNIVLVFPINLFLSYKMIYFLKLSNWYIWNCNYKKWRHLQCFKKLLVKELLKIKMQIFELFFFKSLSKCLWIFNFWMIRFME